MSDPFVAEIKIFAGNFAPRGWSFCNGQLLPISQNTALFSLIGTTYGGDGRTTTALPNLQGRAPMHPGRGPGLTSRRLGETGGLETVALTEAQMPNHTHVLVTDNASSTTADPQDHYIGGGSNNFSPAQNETTMAVQSLPNQGGGQSHDNVQPLITLNYIIALVGLYPSRS